MKNHRCLLLTSLLALGAGGVQAQSSRSSLADVGVVNSSISPSIGALNDNYSDTGATVSANATHTFTGQDRTGNTQAMTFTGSVTASAEYGQLHSSVTGTVTNTYYNPANPVYYDYSSGTFNEAGSPTSLDSIGFATFKDTLQFGGALQAGGGAIHNSGDCRTTAPVVAAGRSPWQPGRSPYNFIRPSPQELGVPHETKH